MATNQTATSGARDDGRFLDQNVRRGVKSIISSGDRVLLINERRSDGTRFWTLPGGAVETDESLHEALFRELREELDCDISVSDPIGSFWYGHTSTIDTVSFYTVFESTLRSRPVPNPREGILEYRWVHPTELPPTTLPQVQFLLQNVPLSK